MKIGDMVELGSVTDGAWVLERPMGSNHQQLLCVTDFDTVQGKAVAHTIIRNKDGVMQRQPWELKLDPKLKLKIVGRLNA